MTPKAPPSARPGVSMSASMAPAGPASVARSALLAALLDSKQLDVEYERRVRRDDATCAALPVAQSRRDDEAPLSADGHTSHALIPALDHLARADAKAKRLIAIARAVELLAFVLGRLRGEEPARVVHDCRLPGFDGIAAAGVDVAHELAASCTPARRISRRFSRCTYSAGFASCPPSASEA